MAVRDGAEHLRRVWRYYDRGESRLGYRLLLGGTKHFGWYEQGQSRWRFGTAMRRMEAELGARLDVPAGSMVLDAGCGMGDVARALATRFALDVTGIDILDFNIEEAQRRSQRTGLAGVTRFAECDYHDLPFPDESFDGAYTMETLVHAAQPERVLAGLRRTLRPHGRLVLFEYSRTPAVQVSQAANEALERVCQLAAMPAWLRFEHGCLEALLDGAGFVVESATDVTDRMLPMLHAFATLGRLPYLIGRLIRRTEKVANALSGVEMWRHQQAWRYNIYVARKPGPAPIGSR